MAKQTIDIGSAENDGTGESIRSAFDKCNDNFDEIYTAGGGAPVASVNGYTGTVVLDADDISGIGTAGKTNSYNDLFDTPTLGTIASAASGDYIAATGGTFTGDIDVPDEAYGGGWDGSTEAPTKNALYDKIEAIVAGGGTGTDIWTNFTSVPDVITDIETLGANTGNNEVLISTGAGVLAWENGTTLLGSIGAMGVAGGTFTGDISVPDEAYGSGWNASVEAPTKNAIYDKIESLAAAEGLTTAANIAAVEALTSHSAGDVLYLYASGLEGLFTWVASDLSTEVTADTAQGVYIKATDTAATSGAWVRSEYLETGTVNVMWFGADDTGVSESVTAFKAAGVLGAANIYVPPGNFSIEGIADAADMKSNTIVPLDGQRWFGPGTLVKDTVVSGFTSDFFDISDTDGVTIEGLTFTHTTGSPRQYCIYGQDAANFTIRNCKFPEGHAPIFIAQGSTNFLVTENDIRGGNAGIVTGGGRAYISGQSDAGSGNTYITVPTGHGCPQGAASPVVIRGTDNYDGSYNADAVTSTTIRIVKAYVGDDGAKGRIAFSKSTRMVDGGIISDNRMQGTNSEGIDLNYNNKNITVSNNYILMDSSATDEEGIDIGGGEQTGIVVSGNIIDLNSVGCTGITVKLDSDGTETAQVLLSGNVVVNGGATTSKGIYINGGSVEIDGFTGDDLTYGVEVTTSTNGADVTGRGLKLTNIITRGISDSGEGNNSWSDVAVEMTGTSASTMGVYVKDFDSIRRKLTLRNIKTSAGQYGVWIDADGYSSGISLDIDGLDCSGASAYNVLIQGEAGVESNSTLNNINVYDGDDDGILIQNLSGFTAHNVRAHDNSAGSAGADTGITITNCTNGQLSQFRAEGSGQKGIAWGTTNSNLVMTDFVSTGSSYDNWVSPENIGVTSTLNGAHIFSLADDAATSFTPPGNAGFVKFTAISGTRWVTAHFRTLTPECTEMAAGANGETTTGALSGTLDDSDGTNGNIIVSAHTDGKLYFGNRSGGTATLHVYVEAAIQ